MVTYRYGGGAAGQRPGQGGHVGDRGGRDHRAQPAAGGRWRATRVSLVDALDAIPAEVHRHDRAVIADDFKALAEQVAGVPRAEALPLLQPDNPPVEAAGVVVSVAVFPDDDLRNPGAPLPETRPAAPGRRATSTRGGWSPPSCT